MAVIRKVFLEACLLSILQYIIVPTLARSVVDRKKLLVVSMDGFRYDYFQKADTPNFDSMMESGVTVPYMNSTFVTLTFPAHTSLATGLYEEYHGIVHNRFYDPIFDETFSFSSHEPKWWDAGEPFWTNAANAGMKVGTFFWPGTDVPRGGILPMQYRLFNDSVPFETRLQTVVDWLSRDDFDLCILYFEEPDQSGHKYGPDDPRLIPVIEEMDGILGMLNLSLQQAGIKEKTDLIILSDHGMTDIDMQNQIIDINDYVNETLLESSVQWYNAIVHLIPQPGKSKDLVDALSNIEHLHVSLKEDLPERFHYSNNRRITPVIARGDEGWIVVTNKDRASMSSNVANHGFDNDLMSMKTIFVAEGPSFKTGYVLPESISSVDVYPLICHLLKLKPAPNNGSLERVMPLLRSSDDMINSSYALLAISLVSIWIF